MRRLNSRHFDLASKSEGACSATKDFKAFFSHINTGFWFWMFLSWEKSFLSTFRIEPYEKKSCLLISALLVDFLSFMLSSVTVCNSILLYFWVFSISWFGKIIIIIIIIISFHGDKFDNCLYHETLVLIENTVLIIVVITIANWCPYWNMAHAF